MIGTVLAAVLDSLLLTILDECNRTTTETPVSLCISGISIAHPFPCTATGILPSATCRPRAANSGIDLVTQATACVQSLASGLVISTHLRGRSMSPTGETSAARRAHCILPLGWSFLQKRNWRGAPLSSRREGEGKHIIANTRDLILSARSDSEDILVCHCFLIMHVMFRP